MTNQEAYNHGYNGTLTLDELMAQFEAPACHSYDEPPQFSAGGQGRRMPPMMRSLMPPSATWSLMTS